MTASAPRDQGPASVNQIASDESGSAVHHTTSPRPASSHCSACARVAKTAPCVCPISLRLPSVPEVVRISARSREDVSCVGPTSSAPPERFRACSSTYTTSGANDIASIASEHSGSAKMSDAPVEAWRASSSGAVSDGRTGTATAPAFQAPRTSSSQCIDVSAMTMTRSLGCTPCSLRAAARPAAPSAISKNVRGSITPSFPRIVTAVRFGSSASASTTSRAKLKWPGTCQRPSTRAGRSASSSGETCSTRARRRPMRRPFTAWGLSTHSEDF